MLTKRPYKYTDYFSLDVSVPLARCHPYYSMNCLGFKRQTYHEELIDVVCKNTNNLVNPVNTSTTNFALGAIKRMRVKPVKYKVIGCVI